MSNRAVCIHEAGHAVAAVALGLDILGATAGDGGAVWHTGGTPIVRAITAVAGAVACAIDDPSGRQHYRTPSRQDSENLRNAAIEAGEDPEVFIARAYREAVVLLERNWHRVNSLAAELEVKGVLTGGEARRAILFPEVRKHLTYVLA